MPTHRPRPGTRGTTSAAPVPTDRAALVRSAVRTLIAANGLHGAAMSAVAAEAGVATGTAYVHYASKDDLVLAAYREAKLELGLAAIVRVDPTAEPAVRFEQLWLGVYRYLAAAPDRASFLMQIESSPYARPHQTSPPETRDATVAADADPLMAAAQAPDMAQLLLPLPLDVLFTLGIAPAIRLVAGGADLDQGALVLVARACWRAITVPADQPRPLAGTRPPG